MAVRGEIDSLEMSRLRAQVVSVSPPVSLHLRGSVGEKGRRILAGTAKVVVTMICQRCLEPVALQLCAEFRLALVEHESDFTELPEQLDPLLVPRGSTCDLVSLIEDEFILELPIVPRHPDSFRCSDDQYLDTDRPDERRPFSDLGEIWAQAKKQE